MENNKEYEVRQVTELRAVGDSRVIEGTAIVFEKESIDLGGFKEVIKRGAVTQEFIDSQDISMKYNHSDTNGILARRNKCKGSLDINVKDDGVEFRFTAKNTNLGNEVLESVRNGDLSGCSFSFKIANDGDKWTKRSVGYLREVKSIYAIKDLSIVTQPAYEMTTCNTRGLDELKQAEELQAQLDKEVELRKEQDFNDYYKSILKEYLYK
jgi:hypothetical protein